MRDFSFCYDNYLNLEQPDLYLANPNKKFLSDGAIRVSELETELYFNNISSISFTCHYMQNGIINTDYDNIIEGNLILVRNIGWFQITEPNESSSGIFKTKNVRALSLENEFTTKYLTSFGSMGVETDWDGGLDLYYLWNETMPEKSILHIALQKLPSWKVGYIDPTITTETRSFDESNIDAYSFLTQKVSETYNCLFIFDTFEMAINVYNPDNIGNMTNLYFSYHNIVKNIEKSNNLSKIKTMLYVEGGQYGTSSLGISEVNPSGNNYIYNFDYFKDRMSTALLTKLNQYEEEYKNRKELYEQFLISGNESLSKLYEKLNDLKNRVPSIDAQSFNEKLLKLEEEINAESNSTKKETLRKKYVDLVKEKIKFLEKEEGYITTEWDLYGSVELTTMFDSYNGVLALFAGRTDSVSKSMYNDAYNILYGSNGIKENQKKREQEIENCSGKINKTKEILSNLAINIREFLGEELYKELSHYVYEDTFTDTSFIATSTMTDLERLDMEKELYKQALKTLHRVSKPNPTFNLTAMDFVAIKDFISVNEQIKLGDFVTIELKENTESEVSVTEKVRLLKISINWNTNDFELTFSSATSLEESEWIFEEIREQANNASNSIDLNGSGWNYSANQSNFVRDFMLNPLNTALNKLKSSDKEEVTIDNSGIHCKEFNANTSTYSDEQIWITRNLVCFSNDSFKTVCTALGKVQVNGIELYGLVAQYVYGNLIAGQNLIISNDKGSFLVNGDGVKINKLDLTVENDHYKIILGNMNNSADDDIFSIYKKNGNTLTKQLYFNNGNLTITGMLNALAGSKFGNWIIGLDSIYYKYNELGKIGGMYFGVNGLSIGKTFKVDSQGNLYTTNGDYSGKISSTSGKIGNVTITPDGLFGGFIQADTINSINSSTGASTTIQGGNILVNGADNYIMNSGTFYDPIDSAYVESKTIMKNGTILLKGINAFLRGYTNAAENGGYYNIAGISREGNIVLGHWGESITSYYHCEDVETAGTLGWIPMRIYGKKINIVTDFTKGQSETEKERGIVNITGVLKADHIWVTDAVTSSAEPNCRITTDNGAIRYASSSSKRYKRDIVEYSDENDVIKKMFNMPLYTFKYNKNYLARDDERYNKDIIGFITETVEEYCPIAVDHNEFGQAEKWNSNIIIPILFGMIKNLDKRLKEIQNNVRK